MKYRRPYLLHTTLVCLVMVFPFSSMISQNLVPNHSLEIYTECPGWPDYSGPIEAPPWVAIYTANYFNVCAEPIYTGVPENFQGTEPAQDGFAYGGFYTITYNSYSEYLQVRLLDTLTQGACYKVSFWISLADEACAGNQMAALFTAEPVEEPEGMVPQIDYGDGQFIGIYDGWERVLAYFVADGTEEYLTIGNFSSFEDSYVDPDCVNEWDFAYYYMDNVVVEEVPTEQVFVDLGPPVTVCDSFTIDPGGDSEIVYYWNTGHIGPTLTVYTTGTYSVTASYGCAEEFDDIEVTVIDTEPIDIGPDALLLCNGETYDVSLDPDAGEYEWNDGSISSDYTITTPGTYHVTLDDGCELFSDTIEVAYMDVPLAFSLGPDTFFCVGEDYMIDFDPLLGDFEWQDGSTDPFYTIEYPGSYALTISNMCGEVTDEVDVATLEPPSVSLGIDTARLCVGQVLDYEFDEEQGSYLWSDNSTNNFFTISATGSYSVTVSNACGMDSSRIEVLYDLEPIVDLGPDRAACPGDTVVLANGNSSGALEWQDGSVLDSFVVTESGIYSLQISNACGMESDTVTINYVNEIFPPDLGPDLILCPGEEVILTATSTGASYLWSDLSNADTLLVTSTGSYSVEVFTACESYSDTVNITVSNAPPSVQLPDDFQLCEGELGVLDAFIPNSTYVWSDGSILSQLIISSAGTYAVTVSNSCGVDADTVVVSQGEALPMVELGNPLALCPEDTIVLVPVFSNVDQWSWSLGTSDAELEITNPGTYTVEVSNSCGSAFDTILVSSLPAVPPLVLASDTTLCSGQSVTYSIDVLDVDILWFDGTMQDEITVDDSTIVYASISNSCGTSTDTAIVSLFPQTPLVDLGPDQTICPGSIVTLFASVSGVNYLWQDGSTNSSYNVTEGGEYILIISDVCGSTSDTINLIEDPSGPMLDLGADVIACDGEEVIISAGISGVNYLWQDGSTLAELATDISGIFWLQVSNDCGEDSDTIEVEFNPVPAPQNLGEDTLVCEGDELILNAITASGSTVEWSDGTGQQQYIVTSPGVYYVTSYNNCGLESDTILVEYISGPLPFSLGQDTVLCEGQTLLLAAYDLSFDILWQDGSAVTEYNVSQGGEYALLLSNACGQTSDTILVEYNYDQPIVDLVPEVYWCPGEVIVLDASQEIPATFNWSTGHDVPVIEVSSPGIYEVVVSSACDTVASHTAVVQEPDCPVGPVFYIPNVFSPNADGINDVFSVFSDLPGEVIRMKGTIYDRWGNIIYSSSDNPFTWDGAMTGQNMMAGVYVYIVEIEYFNFSGDIESAIKTGDITLIR